VVDDEPPARNELAFLLRQLPQIELVAEAADADECLARLDKASFDAIFMDVRMPRLDGLALARVIGRLTQPPRIVFVTAFENHAVEAFGLQAVDYLLKPVRPERLQVTVRRLTHAAALAESREAGERALDDRLPVTVRNQILLLPCEEIQVAAIEGEQVVVRTSEGRYPTRLNLTDFEARFGARGFLRVHRRYVVNLRHVVSIEGFFNGTYLLKLGGVPDLTVPVSRRHAQQLRAALRL
jgi:two-component system LytT family response regulator/two-component system response regulator LytT